MVILDRARLNGAGAEVSKTRQFGVKCEGGRRRGDAGWGVTEAQQYRLRSDDALTRALAATCGHQRSNLISEAVFWNAKAVEAEAAPSAPVEPAPD